MQSMTGYGRGDVRCGDVLLTVEARAVNHRYLDISWRYPRQYAALEGRMKQLVGRYFSRGRLEIKMAQQGSFETQRQVTLDHPLARQYYEALRALQEALQLPGTIELNTVMMLRDILKLEETPTAADEEQSWPLLERGLDMALGALKTMRQQEGAFLCQDLQGRLQTITQHVATIRQRVPQVVIEYQQRLEQRVKEWFQQVELDADRLTQETVLFAERSDITEELTRLESHIQAMIELFVSSEAVGRKLEFLVQEMNREVNTIGSKSNDVTIAHSVVEIKSELERCREQIQNIE